MTEYAEPERRTPNWPLIAIMVGAVITLAIVVAIFVSTALAPKHASLPTTVALPSVSGTVVKRTVTVSLTGTCAYAVVDGVTSFAIWPKGYSRDSTGDVLAPDGSTYADGGSLTASTIETTAAAVVTLDGGGDSGYLGTMLTQCAAGTSHVVILKSISG